MLCATIEGSRIRSAAWVIISTAASAWVIVFWRPKLTRMEQSASSRESPIAMSTCEGSNAPDVHAEPSAIHTEGRFAISIEAGTSGIVILQDPGRRTASTPLIRDLGTRLCSRSSNLRKRWMLHLWRFARLQVYMQC